MVTSHRGGRRPGEVVMQDFPETVLAREPDILECPIETRDRALVHFLVRAVATMHSDDRRFINISLGVRRWPAERLCPVRGKTLGVLRVVPVAERMTNHFVVHYAGVPSAGQSQ